MRKKTANRVIHGPSPPPSMKPPIAPNIKKDSNALPRDLVRLRAYQKWEAAGQPIGQEVRFWLEAEQELLHAR